MRAGVVAALVVAVVAGAAAAFGGGRATVSVPRVVLLDFATALNTLRTARLRVSVPYFPPFDQSEQPFAGRGVLDNYLVVDQEPKAGQTAATASAVRLALTLPERPPPPPLPPPAPNHPRFAVAPNLIGLTYPRAIRSTVLGTSWRGFWVLLRFTAPLAPAASRLGRDAFRVVSQSPKAGTRMPFAGDRPGCCVSPSDATVTFSVAGPGESAEQALHAAAIARRRAAAAIRSALAEFRVPGAGLFPRSATGRSCAIPAVGAPTGGPKTVPGACSTAVDLAGKLTTVVFLEQWGEVTGRGGVLPAVWMHAHFWTYTIDADGRLIRMGSSGDVPPQIVP